MLQINNISKTFQNTRAVQDLSFDARRGEICGVLGPNGSGKTTTIRMILSIIAPDSGSILWNGTPVSYESLTKTGYLPEERGLYRKSKIGDVLSYFASLKKISTSQAQPAISRWLERFGIQGMENRKIEELSKGNQQKIQFIASVLHKPDLLILDEPFSGLDPINQILFRDTVRELAREGTTIIFCTHQLESAEIFCDRFIILNKGRAAVNGTLEEIRAKNKKNIIRIEFATQPDNEFIARISTLPFMVNIKISGCELKCEITDGATLNNIANTVLPYAQILSMETVKPSLLSIFLNAVGASDYTAIGGAENGSR